MENAVGLRVTHYRRWVRSAIRERKWDEIREAIQQGQLPGGDRCVMEVARKIGHRVERLEALAKNKSVPFLL